MCELTGDKMEAAMRDELRRVEVMAKTLRCIDALFALPLARADAQSREIAEASRLCSEADDEVRERESLTERRTCEAEERYGDMTEGGV